MAQPKGQTSGPGPPASVIKLGKSLRKKYDKGIVQLPGTKPELQKTVPKIKRYQAKDVLLDDVYVKLHILEKSELNERVGHAAAQGTATEMERMAHVFSCGAKELKSLELSEVLTLASRPQCRLQKKGGVRVLALAGAGMGKTTDFLEKGPMEWMKGNIWQDVELLFAFPLRQPNVHLADDLEDLLKLKRHSILRQKDREDILEYVNENLHRVCIVFDGLDEVNISDCSAFIQDVIKGDDLDGVRLIVTSRPSIPVIELAKKHPFNMRIEVLGFSEDDVARYVNNVLKPDDAAQVLAQMEASPSLAGYMQIPVNAANVCKLYRSGVTTIPTTMSGITSAVIRQVIQHNEKKKVDNLDVAESLEDVNPILLDPVKELQAFAFKMLVDKVMVFEKRHFDQCQLSKEARLLGFLVACDDDSPDAIPQFVFTHLSIHESLSARHVASSITQADDAGWMVQMLGSLTGHLNTFWRFLAAELNAAGVDSLIGGLLAKSQEQAESHSPEEQVIPLPSSASIPSPQAMTISEDIHGDMCVERLLQHLGNCFHIINPDSLGGPVSQEFMQRYVKPRHPVRQETSAASSYQGRTQQETSASRKTAERDISNLKHFFSASHSELCQVADNLSEHLDITNAERLAERLLEGVVHGSGTLAVQAVMPRASELRGRDFLRALLQLWKQRVPRASIQMLYRATADFDPLIAAKCFPSLDRRSLAAAVPEKELEEVYLGSEQGKQLLLLCCHCYQEYCCNHDDTPLLPQFMGALSRDGNLNFHAVQLTFVDCRAIGLVLRIYHSVLSSVSFRECYMNDAGYGQLAAGLGTCQGLCRFSLVGNSLTDLHANHIAMVIRNNRDTLKYVYTGGNNFSSVGNADVHRCTHLCLCLVAVGIGGSQCVDSRTNFNIINRILGSCLCINNLFIGHCSLDKRSLDQLQPALASHRLQSLELEKVGITPAMSPLISCILKQQQPQLRYLSLNGNPLTTTFLLENYNALGGCAHLVSVYLTATRLSSLSLSVIASLLRVWPSLAGLNLRNNDFRDDNEGSLEFSQAVAEHSILNTLQMPDKAWINSELLSVLSGISDDQLSVEFENYDFGDDEQDAASAVGEVQASVQTEDDTRTAEQ